MLNIIKLSVVLFFLVGCDNSSSTDGATDLADPNKVSWNAIPEKYNPIVTSEEFATFEIDTINLSLFGGNRDANVLYSKLLRPGEGVLRLYIVSSDNSPSTSLNKQVINNSLKFHHTGMYQCNITVVNSEITKLDGKCYVRIEVILPESAKIEVYNSDQRLTKRFWPISNQMLLSSLVQAPWSDDKLEVIADYLDSHTITNTSPRLTTRELSLVLSEFSIGQNKLKAFEQLHSFTTDRENLSEMIEANFTHFDKEKACIIAGL